MPVPMPAPMMPSTPMPLCGADAHGTTRAADAYGTGHGGSCTGRGRADGRPPASGRRPGGRRRGSHGQGAGGPAIPDRRPPRHVHARGRPPNRDRRPRPCPWRAPAADRHRPSPAPDSPEAKSGGPAEPVRPLSEPDRPQAGTRPRSLRRKSEKPGMAISMSPQGRAGVASHDEDELEIPAFLRRQAN